MANDEAVKTLAKGLTKEINMKEQEDYGTNSADAGR